MRESDLRVLVVGGGGREHALAAQLASSPTVETVISAPGNAGMSQCGQVAPVDVTDTGGLIALAEQGRVDLVVCGPEIPLINGLGDAFLEAGIPFFGPLAHCARLEGSKIFAKRVMNEAGVPTGDWEAFDDYEKALRAACQRVEQQGGAVIKADGAAAGKGVFVCSTAEQSEQALKTIMIDRAFGSSGDMVLVEERLSGPEVSVMVIATGDKVLTMPPAQDHKRAYDNDEGPNTGGMGCYSPVPLVDDAFITTAVETTVLPVLRWFGIKGNPYFGCLYAGLMLTERGPMVLEYNCRFGDPETQVVLPLLQSDLAEILVAAVGNRLHETSAKWYDGSGVCVVLASGGYPARYSSGYPISGVGEAEALGAKVFHAGTALEAGQVVTSGGRVLGVTALGPTFADARKLAYDACSKISFKDMHYRKDIGARVS